MAIPVVFDAGVQKFTLVDTGTTVRDITDYIISLAGLPGPRELSEATTLNQTGRLWHPSLENGVITLEMVESKDALVGTDTVFGPQRTDTSARAFTYGPFGSTATFPKYSGTCWLRNYVITGRVGTLLVASVELQVQGAVGRTTF